MSVWVLALAVLADAPYQTLRYHEIYGAGHVEGFDAHVDHTGDRTGCIVGVEGRQHQMAGERRLDGNASGLQVPDLTDHDDVRILPQERFQGGGKGESDLVSDQDLIDA